jgi:hypothetical protein
MLRGTCLLLAFGTISPPQDDVVIRTTTSLVEVRVVAETTHGSVSKVLRPTPWRAS